MIRDIDIAYMRTQKVAARSYACAFEPGEKFRRVIVEIDSLTIRLDPNDAQRLRDALDRVLSEQPLEAA
jgi:hypothetical protein